MIEIGRLDESTSVKGCGLSPIIEWLVPIVVSLDLCSDATCTTMLFPVSRLNDTLQVYANSLWLQLTYSPHIKAILAAHHDFSEPLDPLFLQVEDLVTIVLWVEEGFGSCSTPLRLVESYAGVGVSCPAINHTGSDYSNLVI